MRYAVDNYTTTNDRLLSEVLAVGERHRALIYATPYSQTPDKLLVGSCVANAEVAVVVACDGATHTCLSVLTEAVDATSSFAVVVEDAVDADAVLYVPALRKAVEVCDRTHEDSWLHADLT